MPPRAVCVPGKRSAFLCACPRRFPFLATIRCWKGSAPVSAKGGYHLLLINDQPIAGVPAYIEACLSARADSILYVSHNRKDIPEQELALIRQNGIPLSVVDCLSEDRKVSSAVYDYYAATSLRVEALHSYGIPRVVYLTPEVRNVKFDLRIRGVLETAEKCGMAAEILSLNGEPHAELAKDSAPGEPRLDFPVDVTNAELAIFRFDQEETERLKKLIYKLPGDTGILHDFPRAQPLVSDFLYKRHLLGLQEERFPWHTLSVAHTFPHYEIGYEAARSLLEAIEGKAPRKLSFQPVIIPTDPRIY